MQPDNAALLLLLQGAECDAIILTTAVTRPGAFASGDLRALQASSLLGCPC